MNSNERRLKILYLLQSGKRISVKTITDTFGISRRTVFRDLRVIQDLGVPVTHYTDEGYGVLRDGLIPPIMFSFRELSVIIMGLSFVKSQVDEEMSLDAESVMLKINNAVPHKMRSWMNILEEKTVVSPFIHNVEKRDSGGGWFELCNAFVENKTVEFLYKDKTGNKSRRIIDPKFLVHYTDHWNVIGYCFDRRALRSFVLSRMEQTRLLTLPPPTGINYSRNELLYGRADKTETITVEIQNSHLFSFLTELPGKKEDQVRKEESTVVTFKIDDLDFINEWLLRFGKHVTIVEPKELKHLRSDYLKSLL